MFLGDRARDMSEERIEEMNPLFYDAIFFNTVFLLARRGIGWMDGD